MEARRLRKFSENNVITRPGHLNHVVVRKLSKSVIRNLGKGPVIFELGRDRAERFVFYMGCSSGGTGSGPPPMGSQFSAMLLQGTLDAHAKQLDATLDDVNTESYESPADSFLSAGSADGLEMILGSPAEPGSDDEDEAEELDSEDG
jgi:hypothetical protein